MSAILFIIFNRPDTTLRVFNAIKQAKPSHLYIAADAPRTGNLTDAENCKAARSITENIDWPCEVKRLYQEKNLGCSFGPRAAFDWFFAQEPEGIILEDDCLPHPDFFMFAATMLERYRDNKKIISINESNLGYQVKDGNSYTFSHFMNMWGWATWANRAGAIDYTLNQWRDVKHPVWFLYKKMRQHIFDTDIKWYKYWQHKFDLTVTQETVSWWDWQWIWHQTLHRQLSVVPAVNLVSNIGFDANATHTQRADNPAANIATQSLQHPYRHPSSIQHDVKYEEHFVKWVWCYHKRLPFPVPILQHLQDLLYPHP
ncbi:MAG: hypothetical protein WCI49_16055 [Ferruginibacter sp.]